MLYRKVHVPLVAEELHKKLTVQFEAKNRILKTLEPSIVFAEITNSLKLISG